MFKSLTVRVVKPLVGESVWQRLRGIPSLGAPREAEERQPTRRQRLRQMSLTELALEFKTDKATVHNYTRHYQRHLQHLKRERFTLLEIGIGGYRKKRKGGASLRMWKHFFPRAQIIGLDIQDKSFVERHRIKAYRGSQTDEELLKKIVADAGGIRVVIDDGSHRPEHVRETFRILFPLLADDGIYAIEDTQTSYWPEWGGSEDRNSPHTTMALVKDLVDGLNYEEYVDDHYAPSYTDRHVVGVHAYHNLVIIEKGTNAEGTRKRRLLRKRYQNEATAREPVG